MIFIKVFLPFLILPFSALAQTILSPVPCTLICIEKSMSATSCPGAKSGVTEPSSLPCLCADKIFLREVVNCIVNSAECRNIKDQQDSFKYAIGLCESNGVQLPGDTPDGLPSALGVYSTRVDNINVRPTVATTFPIVPSPTPIVTVIDEIVTTMITVTTSIACEPLHAANGTYTVVVSNNITRTMMPEPTEGGCGNFTVTIPFTTTRKSTRTTTMKTPTVYSYNIEPPTAVATFPPSIVSGAQGATVESGFMLGLLGLIMLFV